MRSTELLIKWWNDLQEDVGDRAELRRCNTLEEIRMTRTFNILKKKVDQTEDGLHAISLSIVAGLMSFITKNSDTPLPEAMGKPPKGEKLPPVRSNSLQILLRTEDRIDLYEQLRRIILKLDRQVNLKDLINLIRFWGLKNRERLAMDYWRHAPEEA